MLSVKVGVIVVEYLAWGHRWGVLLLGPTGSVLGSPAAPACPLHGEAAQRLLRAACWLGYVLGAAKTPFSLEIVDPYLLPGWLQSRPDL